MMQDANATISNIMSSEETKAKRKRGDSPAETERLLERQPGNELQGLKRGILRMGELEVACRSMEKELHAEWSYSAPPLFLLSNNAGCIESDAGSVVDQKCRELEARRTFLENALHVFRDDSSTKIPHNYWTDQGLDQDYVVSMEEFLIKQLRELTNELLTNAGNRRKCIRLNPYADYSEESDYEGADDEDRPVLQHDDVLLPLWEKFANALRVQHFHSIETFSIRNVQLHPTVLSMLGPALSMKIGRNEFPDMGAGVDFVHTVSESNSRVKVLTWKGNPIESMDHADRLCKAIHSFGSLQEVCFTDNAGTNDQIGNHMMCSLISSGYLTALNLGSSNIQTMGGSQLPDFLATNPPLNSLSLSDNFITDNDAVLISASLKRNTNLRHLYISGSGSGITTIGINALANAIYDSNATSLNDISDCNHTCCLAGFADIDFVSKNFGMFPPMEVKQKKIYLTLSARHRDRTNVHCLDAEFGDDSLKLAHLVLARVNLCSDILRGSRRLSSRWDVRMRTRTSQPLSLMYEILRGWRMPELYEQNARAIKREPVQYESMICHSLCDSD